MNYNDKKTKNKLYKSSEHIKGDVRDFRRFHIIRVKLLQFFQGLLLLFDQIRSVLLMIK